MTGYVYKALIAALLMPFGLAVALTLILLLLLLIWMRPRRYYFVRHGETVLNAQGIRQGEAGPLSPRGRTQAERTGRYLAHFPITLILASPFERARETADIIHTHLHVPIRYSRLLGERRNPSEIIGRHGDEPQVARIVDAMDKGYHGDDYRYSDEENFIDLKHRAKDCLTYLAQEGGRETCVVTHSIFLKMLIAFLLYRNDLHAADYVKLSFFNASDNAAITVCEWHPWKAWNARRGWEVVTYNEQPPELPPAEESRGA